VAHWLRDRGFEACAVRGGIAALTGEGLEAEQRAGRSAPAGALVQTSIMGTMKGWSQAERTAPNYDP
jgi:hypothetical protein